MSIPRKLLTLVIIAGVVLSAVAVTPPAPALAVGTVVSSNEDDADQYSSTTKNPVNGNRTVVWWADDGAKEFRVRAATSRNGGANWDPEVTIFAGPKGQDIYGIRSAYDSNGGLHVVFGFGLSEGRSVRYWYVVPGANPSDVGNWRNGGNLCASGTCLEPDIATDRNGNVFVSYEDTDRHIGIRFRAGTNGGWSDEKRVSATDRQLGALAVSPNGKLHVMHAERGKQVLRYVRFASFGSPTPEEVTVLDGEGVNDAPDLAVGPNGNVHLVWDDSGNVRHREYDAASNSIGGQTTIGTSSGRPNVSVAVGGSGTVYVTWNQDNFKEIRLAKRVGGNWQSEENVAGPDPASRYQRMGQAVDNDVSMALVEGGVARILLLEEAATDKTGPVITSVQIPSPAPGSQRINATITGNDLANSGAPVGISRVSYTVTGDPTNGPFAEINFSPVQQLTNFPITIDLANPAAGGKWTNTQHRVIIYLVDANNNASAPYVHPVINQALPAAPNARYLAEGYTGAGFDTYLTLANPNPTAIEVSVTFQYAGTSSGPAGTLVVVGANQRTTLTIDTIAGENKELSFKLESPATFAVERPMYFASYGSGAARMAYNRANVAAISGVNGGHLGVAARAPAPAWYFAEGYTGGEFDTYFTIQNPNTAAATVRITYYLAGGGLTERTLTVSGQQRKTVAAHLASDPGGLGRNQAFSAKVETTNGQPLIVERVMYFRYASGNVGTVTGGTATLGATATNTTWYFAEGYTGGGFDEYLTIQNPNAVADVATITYFVEGQATPTVTQVALAANSRTTVTVNGVGGGGLGGGKAHATRVQTTQQTVIERPMYFTYNGTSLTGVDGGHNVMGATSLITPGTSVIMAEGFTGAGFDQYLTFQNPNPTDLTVTITYLNANGSNTQRFVGVPAFQRKTVVVHSATDPAGIGPNQEISVRVTAPSTPGNVGILAERVMYFRYNGVATGGSAAFGVIP